MPAPADPPAHSHHGTHLGPWDAGSLIVGIVIGTGIFLLPPLVFQNVPSSAAGLGVWALGGLLSLIGALCYCELATAYPRDGGDYVYLTHAFGPWAGFLFAWTRCTVILTGNIGAMAYAFADYAVPVLGRTPGGPAGTAAAVVAALTLVNVCGVVVGKNVQNALSLAKGVAMLAIMAAGMLVAITVSDASSVRDAPGVRDAATPAIGLALVFVLYAFGGWSDAAFVAAEVRDQQRNVPRALLLGMTGITLLYLGVNAGFLAALGLDGLRATATPASDVLEQAWGAAGGRAIGVIVMLSALGAINGMLFVGSRVVCALGEDYPSLGVLGRWNRRRAAPVAALATLGVLSILVIVLVGTEAGHAAFGRLIGVLGVDPPEWDATRGGFETLVTAMAPTFWVFFLLTGAAVIVLRRRDPHRPRPFRIPLYPLPPLVFCLTSVYMLYSSVTYAGALSWFGFGPLAIGLVLYALSSRKNV